MRNFKDESFIGQYLSPKLIRDFKLFAITDNDKHRQISVDAIHDDPGYQKVRATLSEQYNLGSIEPNIQVYNVAARGDRSLMLRHTQFQRKPLDKSTDEVLKHVARLWGFNVRLESVDSNGRVTRTFECEVAR